MRGIRHCCFVRAVYVCVFTFVRHQQLLLSVNPGSPLGVSALLAASGKDNKHKI